MTRFADFDALVATFMSEFGFNAVYTHVISSTPNDATGEVGLYSEDIAIQAIKMELIRPQEGRKNNYNSLMEEAELMLYVRPTEKVDVLAAALRTNPSADYVTFSGSQWRIVTVKEYNPGADDCVLYEFFIKQ